MGVFLGIVKLRFFNDTPQDIIRSTSFSEILYALPRVTAVMSPLLIHRRTVIDETFIFSANSLIDNIINYFLRITFSRMFISLSIRDLLGVNASLYAASFHQFLQ